MSKGPFISINGLTYNNLKLYIFQGYGLTETCACASLMQLDDNSTGSSINQQENAAIILYTPLLNPKEVYKKIPSKRPMGYDKEVL